jgi:hypothetical protein
MPTTSSHPYVTSKKPRSGTALTVVLERAGVQLGFAVNGGDPEQEGAAILMTDIHRSKAELEANDVQISNWRIEERDDQKFQVFFALAPDGICYYFHQTIKA